MASTRYGTFKGVSNLSFIKGRGGYSYSNRIECSNCRKCEFYTGKKLKVCSKCYTIYYCSKDCQKNHWNTHKVTCNI